MKHLRDVQPRWLACFVFVFKSIYNMMVHFVTLDSSFFFQMQLGHTYACLLSTSLSCLQPPSAGILSPNKPTVVNCFSRSSSFSYSFAGSYHTIILSQAQNFGRRVSQTLTFPTSRHTRLRRRGCCIMLRVLTQAYLVPKRIPGRLFLFRLTPHKTTFHLINDLSFHPTAKSRLNHQKIANTQALQY
ncbi:hypothetical protein DFH27DRAFT_276974 [Peziza echinospora]|nr:hypothetical protein DFH27DRAFT_276974 [Peziza echinospora]